MVPNDIIILSTEDIGSEIGAVYVLGMLVLILMYLLGGYTDLWFTIVV